MSIQDCKRPDPAGFDTIWSNHIAVRVSSLERSIAFFGAALGARQLTDALPLDQSACHRLFAGPDGGTARFAFIGFESLDQPAFELIEFVQPSVPTGPTNTWEDGLMHWCFTVPDPEATLAKVEAAGGQLFGEIRRFTEPGDGFSQLYFRDPDGNLFQLLGVHLDEIIRLLRFQSPKQTP